MNCDCLANGDSDKEPSMLAGDDIVSVKLIQIYCYRKFSQLSTCSKNNDYQTKGHFTDLVPSTPSLQKIVAFNL